MDVAGAVNTGQRVASHGWPAESAKPTELTRLREAAREFEAIFVQQMLKSMRQTLPKGGLTAPGPGQELYQDLADEQLARTLARRGGVGLADFMVRSLTRAGQKKPSSAGPPTPINQGEAERSERGPE